VTRRQAFNAVFRGPIAGGPAHEVIAQHRPPARHEIVFVRVVQAQPAVALVHRLVTGILVLPEPGPPAVAVLPVPLRALDATVHSRKPRNLRT